MNTREQLELENAALANELSRQVAHEFSNFVYNLLLRVEIVENAPGPQRFDWGHIKQESRKMAALLRQWERFHSRSLAEELTEVDLHDAIRRVASDAAPRWLRIELTPAISAEAFGIMGHPLEVKHLLRLLLEEAFLACHESAWANPSVSIQTERIDDRAIVRLLAAGHAEDARPALADGEADAVASPAALLAATCQSLAVRLEARIQREPHGHDHRLVSVEFPARPLAQ